jgi:hypothetical protein
MEHSSLEQYSGLSREFQEEHSVMNDAARGKSVPRSGESHDEGVVPNQLPDIADTGRGMRVKRVSWKLRE